MAVKYEYIVLSAPHIEDLVDKINSDEYAEWRIVTTITEHAYTKVILRKDIETNMTADLSSLLALVTDPKSVKDNIELLKTNLDTSRKEGLLALKAKEEAYKKAKEVEDQYALMLVKHDEALSLEKALEEKKAVLEQKNKELLQKLQEFDLKVKAHAETVKSDLSNIDNTHKAQTSSLQDASKKLDTKDQELLKREKAVAQREAALANKEAQVADVKAKTDEFLAILGKRA